VLKTDSWKDSTKKCYERGAVGSASLLLPNKQNQIDYMTNEQAIKLIKADAYRAGRENRPRSLAAMYAMDDIIDQDINEWLDKELSEHLLQFIDVASEVASDYLEEGVTGEELVKGLVSVPESMIYYTRYYELLSPSKNMSER